MFSQTFPPHITLIIQLDEISKVVVFLASLPKSDWVGEMNYKCKKCNQSVTVKKYADGSRMEIIYVKSTNLYNEYKPHKCIENG